MQVLTEQEAQLSQRNRAHLSMSVSAHVQVS